MTVVFTSRFTPNAPSLAGPPTPTGLAASPHTQTQINLTWNPVTSDPGGPGIKDYGLYRIGQGLLAYITATLYTDSGLTQGTTYTYYVTARDLNLVESAQSLPATATTYVGPPVPTGLTAIVNSTTQIQINWNNSSDPGGPGISRYGVYLNGAKQGEVAPVSYLFNGLNPGTTYSFQVSSIDVNNIESAPCTAVLATTQGGAGLTVYHGQSLTFTGTGFGAKSQTLFVHDYGQGPVGSLNSQWSGGWPSACTAAQDNLQTQALTFAPTGAALGTPDPFVSGLMAGCHGNPGAGANAGYNVNPWVSFTPPTFPYAIYARHWTRADPNWTFHLANGEYNYKMYTLGTGTSAYGDVYWYWNFDPPAIGNNTVVSLGISNDVNGGLQNPDANGNSNYWPGNSSNPNHNYPLTLSPFNSSNGTGGWINQEFEVKVTSTTGTAASGGGYINWWNQFNKVVAYEGSTDTMSDPHRSFALEGYSVQYPYETNFRYLLNCTLDISGPGATHVARVYWSASSSDADGANREVGITNPGNWSNTSITTSFWQGAFPTGTAVYPVILTESGAKTIGTSAYTIVAQPANFQLATGHYVPAVMAPTIISPRPDSETNTSERYRMAPDGIPWSIPIILQGGSWPFNYAILNNGGATGLTIGAGGTTQTSAPYGGNGYGVLSWASPVIGTYSITVQVTTQDFGRTAGSADTIGQYNISFTLTVADHTDVTKFVYLDAVNGLDSNNGSFAAPWKTLTPFAAATTTGKQLIINPGTYNFNVLTSFLDLTSKAKVWIGSPNGGAQPLIEMNLNWSGASCYTYFNGPGASCSNVHFHGIPTNLVAANDYFHINAFGNRGIFFGNTFDAMNGLGTTPTNFSNWSGIAMFANAAMHEYVAAVNNTFQNFQRLNSGGAMIWYSTKYWVMEGNSIIGFSNAGTTQHGAISKGHNSVGTMRNNYVPLQSISIGCLEQAQGPDGGAGDNSNLNETCWNYVSNTPTNNGSYPSAQLYSLSNVTAWTGWIYRNSVIGGNYIRSNGQTCTMTQTGNILCDEWGILNDQVHYAGFTTGLTMIDGGSNVIGTFTNRATIVDSTGQLLSSYAAAHSITLGTTGWIPL